VTAAAPCVGGDWGIGDWGIGKAKNGIGPGNIAGPIPFSPSPPAHDFEPAEVSHD